LRAGELAFLLVEKLGKWTAKQWEYRRVESKDIYTAAHLDTLQAVLMAVMKESSKEI